LYARNALVNGEEKKRLKTQYRKREIRLTNASRKRLIAATSALKMKQAPIGFYPTVYPGQVITLQTQETPNLPAKTFW